MNQWLFNPQARLNLSLAMPVKGANLRQASVLFEQEPELAAAIWRAFSQPETLDQLAPELLAQLHELGLLLPAAELPAEPRWRCPLPLADEALIPYADGLPEPPAQLMLNPSLAWQREEAPPPEISGRLREASRIDTAGPLCWLDDPGTRVLRAYHPAAAQLRLMGLLHGRVNPAGLAPALRRQLYLAGVLVEPGYLETRYAAWQAHFAAARATMAASGYAVLRELLNPIQLASLRSYFRQLAAEGYFTRGDSQVKLRDSIYNEPMARFLHHQLNYLVNQVTPEPVIPSYCYLSSYRPGAVLRRHRDRRQCSWNMSLVLDMDPEQPQATAWPIYLDLPVGLREVRLGIGDAVIYRGHEIEHWRDALGANQHVTACFFHFVDEHFEESLD